jgi:MinD-like ATPase involved in chromosome partitioning or flagellar assembly/DNA-binding NarL/FixJ family response regulator
MTELIHVLLIEDNRLETRQIQHWLAANTEVAFEVEWVDGLVSGLERLSRGGIDVVLLDLNLPDSRGLETFETLHERAPEVPVVVLTGEHDESLGTHAVQLGAEDYLVKQQVDGGRLSKIVQYAVFRHRAQVEAITKALRSKSGRVVSFLGAKGGVGTTTLAVNVAVALAETGKSVILAELKPSFGGLASSLQRLPATSLANLLDVPADRIGECEVDEILCQGPGEIRVLFGSHAGATCRELDADRTKAVIKGLARLADFVILDLPGWPSAAVSVAARLSQYVGLVLEREPVAVHCAQAAVAQLTTWGVGGGLVGAIIVGRSNLAVSMGLAAIRSQLGCGILRMIPPAADACCKAHQDGRPLVLSQPNDDAAQAYVETARLVADDRGVRIAAV